MVARDNFYSDEEPLSKYSPVTLHLSTATYYTEQSIANSNSFKIAQKTVFEAKGQLYTTDKVIQRISWIYIHSSRYIAIGEGNGKSSTVTIK